MPYTEAARKFMYLCGGPNRSKARGKCPPKATAQKLAHEASSMPTKPPVKKRRR